MMKTLAKRGSKNEIELLFLFVMGWLKGKRYRTIPAWSPVEAVKGAPCRGLHKLDILITGGSSLTS